MVHRNYRCVACNGGHWFYRSVWGRCVVSRAMGGLLEEMEEGRLLECVGKICGRLYESGQWEEHFTGNVGEILLWTSCFGGAWDMWKMRYIRSMRGQWTWRR